MNAELPAEALATATGARAKEILRRCVHCGFCNATCPTYQLAGDERDGPRGRIYLIKEMLEAGAANATAAKHLDRCLTCRACETTCPSGVQYGELAEIGRELIARQRPAGLPGRAQALLRRALLRLVPSPRRLRRAIAFGRLFRWLLPRSLKALMQVPHTPALPPSKAGGAVLLQGCAQQVLAPAANVHLARLLAARGIEAGAAAAEGCCGGLALHLGDKEGACQLAHRNIAAVASAETIISTASGCGVTWKEYGRLLGTAEARAAAAKVRDAAEVLQVFSFAKRLPIDKVAWHPPCTLQHGQRITGLVEGILRRTGYELTPVRDAHLCCGAAGTYSLLHPKTAGALGRAKAKALLAGAPAVIATANVGCEKHLAGFAGGARVLHWIELLA